MAKRFPHQMAKKNPHFQIDIFVIGCEKHSRRNAFLLRQCLPFSWTTLRGKYCRHPIAVMGVVDMLRPYPKC